MSQLKPLNHLRRRKSRMLCFISWYIHFFWHLGNLSYFFMSLCSKPPTDVFSNNLWSSCLCTVGWPGLECWEPAFSRMWPRSSVVVKVKVVLCTLVVVFIHMFCQLVCHLWVNIQNEGKLKKDFRSMNWFLKCQPWLPWPTPPTWRIAVQCKIWRSLILSTKKLSVKRHLNV